MKLSPALLLLPVLLTSCVTFGAESSADGVSSDPVPATRPSGVRSVLDTLDSLKGQPPEAQVKVNGRNFILDCIGTVSAAYWGAEADIRADFPRFEGNGVLRLARSLESRGLLDSGRSPEPGDILVWENTWDRNGDGVFGNDGPTHAGIVRQVDDDGTVHYIHEDYVKGVTVAWMNLRNRGIPRSPVGKIWNSPLYMGSYPGNPRNPPRFLSSDLFLGGAPGGEVLKAYLARKLD